MPGFDGADLRHLAAAALAPLQTCHPDRVPMGGLFLKCVQEQADLADPVQMVAASGEEQQQAGLHSRSWRRTVVTRPPPGRWQRPTRQPRQPEQHAAVSLAPSANWPTEISIVELRGTLSAVPCRPADPLAPTTCSTRLAAGAVAYAAHGLCTKFRVSNRGCLCGCLTFVLICATPCST
jgi:hypothetical protein